MSTNFIDFENPQNKLVNCEIIVLDTCSVINLAAKQEKALDFAKFTLNNDIALCYTTKTIEELHIMKQSQIIPKNKREAAPYLATYIKDSSIEVENILKAINTLPNMYDEAIGSIDSDIINQIVSNGQAHSLRWGDAAIYTVAKQNKLNHIWTYDRDWTNVHDDNMNILMPGRFINNSLDDLHHGNK